MQIYHVAQKKSLEGHQNQNSAYLEIPTMHVATIAGHVCYYKLQMQAQTLTDRASAQSRATC